MCYNVILSACKVTKSLCFRIKGSAFFIKKNRKTHNNALWDRVIAMTTPGMTAQNATYGKVKSLEGSVLLDGLHCVLTAGWREAA